MSNDGKSLKLVHGVPAVCALIVAKVSIDHKILTFSIVSLSMIKYTNQIPFKGSINRSLARGLKWACATFFWKVNLVNLSVWIALLTLILVWNHINLGLNDTKTNYISKILHKKHALASCQDKILTRWLKLRFFWSFQRLINSQYFLYWLTWGDKLLILHFSPLGNFCGGRLQLHVRFCNEWT